MKILKFDRMVNETLGFRWLPRVFPCTAERPACQDLLPPQERFIRSYYAQYTDRELARLLGTTVTRIKFFRHQEGLRKDKK